MADIFRDHLLKGKAAFITGGGSGINLRIAERFAAQGARVGLMGRTQEKLDRAAAGIRAGGGEALGFAGDVRDYEACAAAPDRKWRWPVLGFGLPRREVSRTCAGPP